MSLSHAERVALAALVQRVFIFPADLARTTAFFRDFTRVLSHLPHLLLITIHAVNQYRILYSAAEAGILRVTFFCDAQAHYDDANRTFQVDPLTGIPSVKQEAAFNAITGQGYYTSRSVFRPSEPNTQIAYRIEIKADLPGRRELDWMPKRAVRLASEARPDGS